MVIDFSNTRRHYGSARLASVRAGKGIESDIFDEVVYLIGVALQCAARRRACRSPVSLGALNAMGGAEREWGALNVNGGR
jgi:hypothetical protein